MKSILFIIISIEIHCHSKFIMKFNLKYRDYRNYEPHVRSLDTIMFPSQFLLGSVMNIIGSLGISYHLRSIAQLQTYGSLIEIKISQFKLIFLFFNMLSEISQSQTGRNHKSGIALYSWYHYMNWNSLSLEVHYIIKLEIK